MHCTCLPIPTVPAVSVALLHLTHQGQGRMSKKSQTTHRTPDAACQGQKFTEKIDRAGPILFLTCTFTYLPTSRKVRLLLDLIASNFKRVCSSLRNHNGICTCFNSSIAILQQIEKPIHEYPQAFVSRTRESGRGALVDVRSLWNCAVVTSV